MCAYEDTTGGLGTGYCQQGRNDIKCITEGYNLLTALILRNDKLSQHTKADELDQVLFCIPREIFEGQDG